MKASRHTRNLGLIYLSVVLIIVLGLLTFVGDRAINEIKNIIDINRRIAYLMFVQELAENKNIMHYKVFYNPYTKDYDVKIVTWPYKTREYDDLKLYQFDRILRDLR